MYFGFIRFFDYHDALSCKDPIEIFKKIEERRKEFEKNFLNLNTPLTLNLTECLVAINYFKQFLAYPNKEVQSKAAQILAELIADAIGWIRIESPTGKGGVMLLSLVKELKGMAKDGSITLSKDTNKLLNELEEELTKMTEPEKEEFDCFILFDEQNNNLDYDHKHSQRTLSGLKPDNAPSN